MIVSPQKKRLTGTHAITMVETPAKLRLEPCSSCDIIVEHFCAFVSCNSEHHCACGHPVTGNFASLYLKYLCNSLKPMLSWFYAVFCSIVQA